MKSFGNLSQAVWSNKRKERNGERNSKKVL